MKQTLNSTKPILPEAFTCQGCACSKKKDCCKKYKKKGVHCKKCPKL
jgi:hypothetical protein